MKHTPKRGQWASNIGFILATAGSAVGLGNLVKFPYLASKYGGGAFLIVYLILLALIGFTIMLTELVVGRATRSNTVGAFKKLDKRFTWVGGFGILTGFFVLSYYSVMGGWSIKYFVKFLTGGDLGGNSEAFFNTFTAQPLEPVLWHLLFVGLTVLIVLGGVAGGIERASKFMMPALLILLIIIAIRSVTLPGAMEGVKYFLVPDFSKITPSVIVAALSQVFFSLSLGMGVICTYGSYLSKDENIEKNAFIIPLLDTAIAMIAGFAILPALFYAGLEPSSSTIGSMFIVVPSVFETIPGGFIFGALFFLLVIFAAITSAISILEGAVAFVTEELHIKRKTAVLSLGGIIFIIGAFASLSFGAWDISFPQLGHEGIVTGSLFDFLSNTPDLLLMPIGGLMFCIFVGWIWGADHVTKEVEQDGKFKFVSRKLWIILVKYIAPTAIGIVFLSQLGIIKF